MNIENPQNERVSEDAWKSALMVTAVTAIGSLLPLVISIISYKAYSKLQSDWSPFYKNGEYYLYAATFLTTAGYYFFKNKNKHYDWLAWSLFSILLVLFASTILFALLRVSKDFVPDGLKFDECFLRWTSCFLLILSLVALYLSFLIDEQKQTGPNFPEIRQQNQRDLSDDFDKLQE